MLITSQNAREMALRSAAARRQRKAAVEAALANPAPPPAPSADYVQAQITRMRGQIDRVHYRLAQEKNPQAIERLATALARLVEQERILSGRPLPGAHRPGPVRRPRPAPDLGPLGLDPGERGPQ